MYLLGWTLQCGLQDTQTSQTPQGCSCHPMVDAAAQRGAHLQQQHPTTPSPDKAMFLLRVWFLIVQLLAFQVTKGENSAQNPIAGHDICRKLLIF